VKILDFGLAKAKLAVHHFHEFRTAPTIVGRTGRGVWAAVGKVRITFSLREELGNVWIGER